MKIFLTATTKKLINSPLIMFSWLFPNKLLMKLEKELLLTKPLMPNVSKILPPPLKPVKKLRPILLKLKMILKLKPKDGLVSSLCSKKCSLNLKTKPMLSTKLLTLSHKLKFLKKPWPD